MNKIKDLIIETENRNPTRKPDDFFTYVDVSSVSNKVYRIVNPSKMLGKQAPSRARKEIKKDDVIVATVRPTLKRIAIVPEEYDSEICSTAFCVLRPNKNVVDHEYLYYALLTEKFEEYVRQNERGANYPAVRDSDVKNYELELHDLPNQKKISYVLHAIQDAINKQNEIFNTMSELKNSLMQKFFSEGLRGEPQKETEIGLIPESWQLIKFESVAQFKNGINFTKQQKGNKGVPTIDVLNMYGKGISVDFTNLYRVDKQIAGDSEYLLSDGDILFVRSSLKPEGVGWVSLYKNNSEPTTFCGFIINARIVDKAKYLPTFYAYYFRSERARRIFLGTNRVSITNINQGLLKTMQIPVPSLEEQDEIVNILTIIDKKLSVTEELRKKYQLLFNSTLTKLMAGELRIEEVDLS